MLDVLRSFVVIPLIYLYTLVMATISLTLSIYDPTGRKQHWCARTWTRMIAGTVGAKVIVYGMENLPADRAAVYIANHSSYMDIPAIWGYLPVQFRIMAKRSLFYLPFLGWFLWRAGHIPVDRGNARAAVTNMNRVASRLREGVSLVVFAEGHRSADGMLREFKYGGFKLAQKAKVPVVPLTIVGSYKVLKKDSLVFHPGVIKVFVDAPIETSEIHGRDLDALAAQTHRVISARLAECGQIPGTEREAGSDGE